LIGPLHALETTLAVRDHASESLTKRRRGIDRRYDYRYSILPLVFAYLLRDGRLSEDDLSGLGQEKLDLIRMVSAI
jgi:hypothetical protein